MEKTLASSHTKRSSPSPSTAVNTTSSTGFNRRTKQRLSDATASVSETTRVEDDGDEEEGVEEKIEALQTIVPGGTALGVDALFEETASYILALQCQINAIKVLTAFLERCEKDDMKFGG
ncbi:PREDICTED: transcription factor PAR2-like [Camelina sativa]|uniref:Transcription factor PAR2-like n=1 Tax=Camelina sativa TaxID=90675 RepID=A0ABM0TKM8_CAMSA|nr:PREDICTED: transcription factor PAR2-like [Camelina sativa]